MDTAERNTIESDIAVQGGAAVVAGTRVPVAVLVEAVAAGDSVAEVAESYRVSEAQVRSALMYAAGVVKSERNIALSA